MRPILLLALTLVACAAGPGGNWPSLAKRPAEKIAAGLASAPAAAAVPSTPDAPPPTAPVAMARVAEAGTDLDALDKRWAAQKATTEDAVAKAKTAARESDAWSTAQVELTRFQKVGGQATDIRSRLDAIAGDLASAAAKGEDVSAPLAAAGKLIDRADALAARHAETAQALQLPAR